MVVCPAYQLPARQSQIYQQAIARNVCILSYSHLAVALSFSEAKGDTAAQELLLKVFNCTESMTPAKDAVSYWTALNRSMLDFDACIKSLWAEKAVILDSISAAKEEGLEALSLERNRILRMSRDEAIEALVKDRNLDGKENKINGVADNGLLAIG